MMIAQKGMYELDDPNTALRLFRLWCRAKGIVPDCASIDDLHRFGYYLWQEGFSSEEAKNCTFMGSEKIFGKQSTGRGFTGRAAMPLAWSRRGYKARRSRGSMPRRPPRNA